MITIGDLSKLTQLTVKALRYYHQEGLLLPDDIDAVTGYRFYQRDKAVLRANTVKQLKEVGFSLSEIKAILAECQEDEQIPSFLQTKLAKNQKNLDKLQDQQAQLNSLLMQIEQQASHQQECNSMNTFDVTEKQLEEESVVSIRYKGRYDECGQHFKSLYRAAGFAVKGKAFMMTHDGEYKENDADIEVGVAVKKPIEKEGIIYQTLPAQKVISVMYKGGYDGLSQAYEALFCYAQEHNLTTAKTSKEVYIKGPGLIFPRSPKKFITEVMMYLD